MHDWSYLYSRGSLVARQLSDIDGKTVAVLRDSFQFTQIQKKIIESGWKTNIVATQSHLATLEAIVGGKADIGIVSRFFGEPREREFDLIRSEFIYLPAALFFVFKPNIDPGVIAHVDAVLATLKTDPTSVYFAAYDRWLKPRVPSVLPVWVYAGAALLALLALLSLGVAVLLRRQVAAATASLQENQRKLIQAQHLAHIGDFTWDVKAGSVIWSEAMCAMLGYPCSSDPIDYQFICDNVHHPDESKSLRAWFNQGFDSGAEKLEPRTWRLRRKDGSIVYVEINALIRRENGAVRHVFGTCQDVTFRVLAEHALLNAKKEADDANKTKSNFLANMSHELRTPLNAIIGFTDMLKLPSMGLSESTRRDYLESISTASRHLYALVNDVLDLSAIEAGQLRVNIEPILPADVVDEVATTFVGFANRNNVSINNRLKGHAPVQILSDGVRLRQVLINLLSNAIKYNVRGGSVTIDGGISSAGKYRISVIDTGVGIPADKFSEVFRMYGNLSSEAIIAGERSVIGLSVTKLLVEIMGGTIDFESKEGHGSTFWCEFPIADVATVSATTAAATN